MPQVYFSVGIRECTCYNHTSLGNQLPTRFVTHALYLARSRKLKVSECKPQPWYYPTYQNFINSIKSERTKELHTNCLNRYLKHYQLTLKELLSISLSKQKICLKIICFTYKGTIYRRNTSTLISVPLHLQYLKQINLKNHAECPMHVI